MHDKHHNIPWYRKEVLASLLLLFGIPIPPLIWIVLFLLVTGDIYTDTYNADGSVAKWSNSNRIAAWVILALQFVAIGYGLYLNSIL